jgi:hypothetical protein
MSSFHGFDKKLLLCRWKEKEKANFLCGAEDHGGPILQENYNYKH